jgi:hypothetical protein
MTGGETRARRIIGQGNRENRYADFAVRPSQDQGIAGGPARNQNIGGQGAGIMMKLLAAVLGAVMIAGTAQAQDPTLYKEFGNWGVYRYPDYCRAIAKYERSTVTLAYDSRKDLAVMHVRSQALARFRDEQDYPFEFVMLRGGKSDNGWGEIPFHVINKSDFVGAIGSMKAGALFADLSQSSAFALAYKGEKVEAFELGDIAEVLQSLQRCDRSR